VLAPEIVDANADRVAKQTHRISKVGQIYFADLGTITGNQERTIMSEPLADQVMRKIKQANELYHRLILVAAPSGAGKTTALKDICKRVGTPRVNVNLNLSRRMLDLTERQRVLRLPQLLREIINDAVAVDVVLLDNIEILFDVSLKQDPLRLLQGLSRNKTVVAAWNGSVESDFLLYAAPGHPEYRRYIVRDFLVVSSE